MQGISLLEQLVEELSKEERVKELKQEKKRQKRKNRRKHKCSFDICDLKEESTNEVQDEVSAWRIRRDALSEFACVHLCLLCVC